MQWPCKISRPKYVNGERNLTPAFYREVKNAGEIPLTITVETEQYSHNARNHMFYKCSKHGSSDQNKGLCKFLRTKSSLDARMAYACNVLCINGPHPKVDKYHIYP